MSPPAHALPNRPALPPLFLAAACAWVATICVESASWRVHVEELDVTQAVCVTLGIEIGGMALAAIFLHVAERFGGHQGRMVSRTSVAIIAAATFMALVCSTLYWTSWGNDVDAIPALMEQGEGIEVELASDPAERDYGIVSDAELSFGAHVMKLRLIWPEGAEASFAGHKLLVKGSVLSPQASDSGRWSHQNGYVGTVKATHVDELGYGDSLRGVVTPFRDDAFERIAALEGDSAGLLAGVLLGNKTLFAGTELELAFQTTGLAHLMAVSGTHLAIVTMLLSTLLARTALERRVRSAALFCALMLYVAVTGFAPSAVRACVMCGVALLAGSLRRRPNVIGGLSLCVFAFIGMSPPIVFSTGFQLSVLAVFGLVAFGSLASCWIGRIAPFLPGSIQASVGATVTASFVTLPVTVPLFAQLPLVSPLANIVAAPLITAALSVGMIGMILGAVIAPLGSLVLGVAGLMASACAALVRLLADIPGGCLPVSSGSAVIAVCFGTFVVALWVVWPLPRSVEPGDGRVHALHRIGIRACAATVIALPMLLALFIGFGRFGIGQAPSDTRLVVLDVGQGDSILLQSGDAAVLVDTGEKPDVLVRELAEKSVSHLDAIFISHKDADHAGALRKIAGIVDVDHVYVHEDLLGKEFAQTVLESALWATDGKGAEGVRPGFVAKAGKFALTVVAPEKGGKSENDDSLILLVEFDADEDGDVEARGVLTGDAEENAMRDVASRLGDVDFLKVAHHGSKGGLSDEELDILSPELALISVGQGNSYGHPAPETLRLLEGKGARVYRTDRQGAISVYFAKKGMSVATER